jgi:hypothetical protein
MAKRSMSRKSEAEVVREYVPIDERPIHGVTFDGRQVWFAREGEIVAFDPEAAQVVGRIPVPLAHAGIAFDGEHLYQIAGAEILVIRPSDGHVVRRLPAPGKGEDSGMAWADGYLWVGQYHQSKIHKVNARTGEVERTLSSDRFVTGVTCVDGALWHGASGGEQPCELRRLASDGTVEESLTVPGTSLGGVEGTSDGSFWCAGEKGKLRLVRRKSGSA